MASEEFTHFAKPVRIPTQYEELVSSLTDARLSEGFSQEALAHKIGCTSSLVHKWETRKRVPSGFMLVCWLDSLGYEIEVKKRIGSL
jgi:DNA-binding transcriptional regulator YiaG